MADAAAIWRGIACEPMTLAPMYGFVATTDGVSFYKPGDGAPVEIDTLKRRDEARNKPGTPGEKRVQALYYDAFIYVGDSGPDTSAEAATAFVQKRLSENPIYDQGDTDE